MLHQPFTGLDAVYAIGTSTTKTIPFPVAFTSGNAVNSPSSLSFLIFNAVRVSLSSRVEPRKVSLSLSRLTPSKISNDEIKITKHLSITVHSVLDILSSFLPKKLRMQCVCLSESHRHLGRPF